MNGSLFSITRYMNRVCFKVSGGTYEPKLPPSYPPSPRDAKLSGKRNEIPKWSGVTAHADLLTDSS